ncbi:MAG TPA: YidB family protein [Xanthobacteraceae bacterium]|nr:YidB family protein [Xanthobacteraceae bacterium]
MGLLDELLGGALGGGTANAPSQQTSGGMSPVMMALMALMAYRAMSGGGSKAQAPAQRASGNPLEDILGSVLGGGGGMGGARSGGGLGDILGEVLGGGALGNVLNGGLGEIIKQMQQNGQGDVADSWVGRGQNREINPRDLEDALGPEKMKSLAEQAGLSDVQFMQGLAQGLPQVIDRMTPQGRMPTRDEAERWI